jgi:RHS repeat-associated protein
MRTKGGAASPVDYAYDLAGRLTEAKLTATAKAVAFEYDTAGRLKAETTNGWRLAHLYDEAGNRKETAWSGAVFKVNYDYDPANRMIGIRENGTTSLATLNYGALNQRTGLVRSNGTTESYVYDAALRLKDLTLAAPATPTFNMAQTMEFNPASQVAKLIQANTTYVWKGHPTGPSQEITHDGLDRDGRIAALTDGYDWNGNLTNDGLRRFTYDVENRLVSSVKPSSPTVTYEYDALGRLHKVAGATTSYFVYDGERLVAEYGAEASTTALRRYVHGPGVDEPLVWYEGADKKWLHADRQGSIIAYSNEGGTVETAYTYGPYGEPQNWAGSTFRYTGQTVLKEAELYYYKARVYDPIMGRFLQTDPIGQDDDVNLYAYVGGDPTNRADPLGMQSVVYHGEAGPKAGANSVGHPPGWAAVHAHGYSGVVVGADHKAVPASKIYADLGKAGYAQGTPIVLLICNSGSGGADTAKELARLAGATVYAATGFVRIPTAAVGPGLKHDYTVNSEQNNAGASTTFEPVGGNQGQSSGMAIKNMSYNHDKKQWTVTYSGKVAGSRIRRESTVKVDVKKDDK